MPFMNNRPSKESTPPPNSIYYQFADQLRSANVVRKVVHTWNRTKWANEFKILHQKQGARPQDIQLVLDWYDTIPRSGWVIPTAERFKQQFTDNLKRAEKHFATTEKQTVEVSADAKRLAGEFTHFKWPRGMADRLGQFCQVTMDHFRQLYRDLKEHGGKGKSSTHVLARRLTTMGDLFQLPAYDVLTRRRLDKVWQLAQWPEWGQDVLDRVYDGSLTDKWLVEEVEKALGRSFSYPVWRALVQELIG